MKIIHLNYYDTDGGAARATYRIHASLIKEGVESIMWVNEKKSDETMIEGPTSNINKVINKLRLRLINKSFEKLFKTENKVVHSTSLLPSRWVKYINSSNADIVHLHWIQNEMLSISDIPKINKPIVWTLHDMWAFCGAEHYTDDNRWREGYYSNRPNYEKGFDLNRWTWLRKKNNWKKPIQIITPSKWLASCVRDSFLLKSWPVSVIPNPININLWKPLDKQNSRKQLNLPQNVPLILFGAVGGGKDPRKGFDLLLKSLSYLKNELKAKDLQLIIFGESKPEYQLNLGFPVHYLGNLQDEISLQVVYNAVDVMLVPSRQEAFGQTASEAQACGVPVVAFDIGGLPDIIEHKKSGYLAKAFDIEDLARGISWVLYNCELKKLSAYSRKQAVLKFNQKRVAQNYLKIYRKLLGNYD